MMLMDELGSIHVGSGRDEDEVGQVDEETDEGFGQVGQVRLLNVDVEKGRKIWSHCIYKKRPNLIERRGRN